MATIPDDLAYLVKTPEFVKAFFLVLVDEINRLRTKAEMPNVTYTQVLTQIKNRMAG